jgi:hypothetical protein
MIPSWVSGAAVIAHRRFSSRIILRRLVRATVSSSALVLRQGRDGIELMAELVTQGCLEPIALSRPPGPSATGRTPRLKCAADVLARQG